MFVGIIINRDLFPYRGNWHGKAIILKSRDQSSKSHDKLVASIWADVSTFSYSKNCNGIYAARKPFCSGKYSHSRTVPQDYIFCFPTGFVICKDIWTKF